MQVNSKYPEIIVKNGNGVFSAKELVFKADFEICHYPQNTIIRCTYEDSNLIFGINCIEEINWQLDGQLEDKIKVSANKMLVKSIEGKQITFLSFKDLFFGNSELSNISIAKFPLVGIYELNLDVEIDGWKIKCLEENGKLTKEKSKNWNLQLESCVLCLENKNATEQEYVSKAINITSLLSLALGNDVVFNRQLFYDKDRLIKEEWRRKVDYHFGADRCIPDFNIDKFLIVALANIEQWDEKKRQVYFSTLSYINSSSKGYLEDRLLKISIAWEALAEKWKIKRPKSNNSELDSLKKRLKETINDSQLPDGYKKEFLIDRVLGSLDWEKNTDKMIAFCNQYYLNADKLGLDFSSLNKIRNDIAHTGLFRRKYSKDFLIDLLSNHTIGLQIILLLELNYTDLIESEENKWRTFIKVEDLLLNKTCP
jgi:hypothetical protein